MAREPILRESLSVYVVIVFCLVQATNLRVPAIQFAFGLNALRRGLAIPSALWFSAATLAIVGADCVALGWSTDGLAVRTLLIRVIGLIISSPRRFRVAIWWANNCTFGWRTMLITRSVLKRATGGFALWRCTNWGADLVASATALPNAFRMAVWLFTTTTCRKSSAVPGSGVVCKSAWSVWSVHLVHFLRVVCEEF